MEPPTQSLQGAPGVQIIINDTDVSNSKVYEYIGVSVDKSLSFIDQFDKVYPKAVKSASFTICQTKIDNSSNLKNYDMAFNYVFRPNNAVFIKVKHK